MNDYTPTTKEVRDCYRYDENVNLAGTKLTGANAERYGRVLIAGSTRHYGKQKPKRGRKDTGKGSRTSALPKPCKSTTTSVGTPLPTEPTHTRRPMSSQHCLQCGESRTAVKREGVYCATVSYEGEAIEEWDRHRWRDWSDQELASFGILPEHYDKYRGTKLGDLRYIDCHDRGREHIPLEESERICQVCWHELTSPSS